MAAADLHAAEVARGERFEFGANWREFLATLDDERISVAKASLQDMLGVESLRGSRFLDAGSGSGLFSLAAWQLGADVLSFDYDPQSVACTRELKARFASAAANWTVLEGSVLDAEFIGPLGQFDVVYSWGVLHHTGDMWRAIDHAMGCVAPAGGQLFIAIYNDQGPMSSVWSRVKQFYCSGWPGRWCVKAAFFPLFFVQSLLASLIRHGNLVTYFREYRRKRGMSVVHDWNDWLGGYPFEVARPEQIFDRARERGFRLERLVTTNRLGCNQFVFVRPPGPGAPS